VSVAATGNQNKTERA